MLHIIKANSSLNSIAKHIERTAHPENADPARTHLNRYNLVGYPVGITGLAAAVEHRITNAGITRKISDRQVRCLNLVMTSDNEGMQKIIDSGKLDEWIADNIRWARDTFGSDNVVGAALHMDERTPHLHIAVVPIVTAERKKKAREATAKKRYRTKAANRPRLCADDIMERGKMSRYQDIYAEAMAKYGLERGIRGSEARHIGQHEYYRDCMVKKKGLEEDIGNLSIEKEQLGAETQSLEKRKKELEFGNRWIEKTIIETKAVNERMTRQNSELEKLNRELERSNSSLIATNTSLTDEKKALEADKKGMTAEIAEIESEKSRLIAERSTYAEETEAARKEKETALQEVAEAKAQRDANRKDALSNLANRFTGSKTKRLEAELTQSREEIRTLKETAEQTAKTHSDRIWDLRQQLDRQKEQHESIVRGHQSKMDLIQKFFPDTIAMIPAIEDCQAVRLSDRTIMVLLDCQSRTFSNGTTLYDPNERKDIDVGNVEVQIKRDPTDDNRFRLHLGGKRVFQWFKEKWQRLKQTFSRGIRR